MKLKELVAEYGFNLFILCEKGDGRNHRENGIRKIYDNVAAQRYGEVELHHIEARCTAGGHPYSYESNWIKVTKVTETQYEGGFIATKSESYEIRVRF